MPPKKPSPSKSVTRFQHDADEPRTPETGHTSLLPTGDEVVEVDMGERWSTHLRVAHVDGGRSVVVDMDPFVDPTLLWAGKNGEAIGGAPVEAAETQPTLLWSDKRSTRTIPVLPLQRTEIVTASRIAQITERARRAEEAGRSVQGSFFEEEERELRERERSTRLDFYTYGEAWKNKLICGDSLEVIESLLRYERLGGLVQTIYIDPPYGIKYNANFQQRVDLAKNDAEDGADDVVTVKAFRDTWALGIHTYLTYLRDRLYLSRELLSRTGSVFVQISEANCHLVRAVMDEVFGADNFMGQIAFVTTSSAGSPSGVTKSLPAVFDYLLWYAKESASARYNQLYLAKTGSKSLAEAYSWVELSGGTRRRMTSDEKRGDQALPEGSRQFMPDNLTSQSGVDKTRYPITIDGVEYRPGKSVWKTSQAGMDKLLEERRVLVVGKTPRYVRYLDDFEGYPLSNIWDDTVTSGFASDKQYVVQTNQKVVARCIAMTSAPGDLVFDPTCGSGTTAIVAERLGRRWITCDTSRVAVNVARRRLLSTMFDAHEMLGDTPRAGLRYKQLSRTTLRSVANGLEPETIDLVDQPLVDRSAVRVCGPFEMLSLGRYSPEEWKGSLIGAADDPEKLGNYVEVIARLYRPHAEVLEGAQAVHATFESENERLALTVGPLTGRVLVSQIDEAARQAVEFGFKDLHVLGWAFEVNVGELRDRLCSELGIAIQLVMIRPDTLAEGLKVTDRAELFSPLSLPEVELRARGDGTFEVELMGVTVFDRKQRKAQWISADSKYINAWYLDHEYDGDCFVASEFFFDFSKHPNLAAVAGADVDEDEFELSFVSRPFVPGDSRRIAVKVVDVFGSESTVVKEIPA